MLRISPVVELAQRLIPALADRGEEQEK